MTFLQRKKRDEQPSRRALFFADPCILTYGSRPSFVPPDDVLGFAASDAGAIGAWDSASDSADSLSDRRSDEGPAEAGAPAGPSSMLDPDDGEVGEEPWHALLGAASPRPEDSTPEPRAWDGFQLVRSEAVAWRTIA
jgi:hypothetical protein